MEGIYVGKVKKSRVDKDSADLFFVDHCQDIQYFGNVIDYDKTAYCLVPSDDIILNNDYLLKLRDKVDKLETELTEIKTTRTLREAYIAGVEKGCESLREERDQWKRRWNSVVTDIGESLKANGITFVLKEIHGDGNWDVVIDIPKLNEAKKKVEDLEKKLAASKSNETFWRDRKEEEEDYHHYWLHTYDRAVKQAADKGIHIDVWGTDETCNAGVVVVDNVKAEELEKRVSTLEKINKNLNQKIGAADNALEYWNNTYNDIVIAGKNVGVKIDIKGKKSDCNVGTVHITNEKAEELEKQVKAAAFANDTLDSFSSALTNDYNSLKAEKESLYNQNQTLGFELSKQRSATDYWRNTYYEVVEKVHDAGVSVDYVGCDSDNNCALLHITNHNNQKWQAMLDALKEKGVEVIYMGEEDEKPLVDVKVPGWEFDKGWVTKFAKRCADIRSEKFRLESERDELKEQCDILRKDYVVRGQAIDDLKNELEELKSKIGTCTLAAGADGRIEFIYTYMDGHNEPAHINCLCKNHFDAESVSHGTIPKCSSCAYYVSGSRSADVWCRKPVSKKGPGTVRRLSTEEAEGPACSDFKAKE